ncbi:uncharacterized protein AMSG_00679 [Thecamonas trahens ATCC 50062]|uniref:Uncharacterized protein n=1 Tax=Thecamonas trahens ATCC 50062 TaxID=461836 RepID=A0A0L0DGR1_THETB|nr:hypothetical protein AMSG_00679 [Thecamonas trahens ATCC 50062]KNC50518.1 hypothetical protein AMSG_00679 [Thecamonas trahens ATCC 50062]|eukprot:XP_013762410.1 hypothetical protein AMSG_00679 [Thecamonas trahens ATCC 50062]
MNTDESRLMAGGEQLAREREARWTAMLDKSTNVARPAGMLLAKRVPTSSGQSCWKHGSAGGESRRPRPTATVVSCARACRQRMWRRVRHLMWYARLRRTRMWHLPETMATGSGPAAGRRRWRWAALTSAARRCCLRGRRWCS